MSNLHLTRSCVLPSFVHFVDLLTRQQSLRSRKMAVEKVEGEAPKPVVRDILVIVTF